MSYALHAASILAHSRKSFKVYLRVGVGVRLNKPGVIQRAVGTPMRSVDRRKAL